MRYFGVLSKTPPSLVRPSNTARALFAEPAVRRALTTAIDRQTMIETLMSGYARVAVSPIISTVWAFNNTLTPWPYDPDAARRQLENLGWSTGSDGILERDGQRFAFELATNSSSRTWRDASTMIQEVAYMLQTKSGIRPQPIAGVRSR